jgi:outer membrane biosynthesis protein TonB
MRGAVIAALIARAAPAAGTAASAPLPPSGKWLLEGQDNMCAITHAYGDGKEQVTLGFRPTLLQDTMDVIWFRHGADALPDDDTAQIGFAPSGKKAQSASTSFSLKDRNERLSSFTIDRSLLATFATSSAVTVKVDRKQAVSIAPAEARRAIDALAGCEQTLFKVLGVDPTFRDRMATPAMPIGSPQKWFGIDDYPAEARQGGAEGKTAMLLTIGIDGRISNCVPFGRSGNAAIDKASCSKFIQRGRFKPAIGKDGQPMVSYQTRRVHWTMQLMG